MSSATDHLSAPISVGGAASSVMHCATSALTRRPPSYAYDAIDSDKHDFRLLRLLGSAGGEIECELFHASFDSQPYEALSYVWGNAELVESISVHGKTLRITDNLHAALLQLRLHDRDRVLWIDAVCINQDDDSERGHQVQRMGDVFWHAERVLVWLGKATIEVELLMDWLETLAELDLESEAAREASSDERLRTGLRTLLGRPWFARVWVLQEVANARSAIVCAGKDSVSASVFALAPLLLETPVDAHANEVLGLMARGAGVRANAGHREPLSTLMVRFRGCKASDERDKIFALHGMSQYHEDAVQLLPDYTVSTVKLAESAVRYLLETKQADIASVLNFVSSFHSITAVCVVPDEDDSSLRTQSETALVNDALKTLQSACEDEAMRKASIMRIESYGDEPLCYAQARQLNSKRLSHSGTSTHPRQNVVFLHLSDFLESALELDSLGFYSLVDLLIGYYIIDQTLWLDLLLAACKWDRGRLVRVMVEQGWPRNGKSDELSWLLYEASYMRNTSVMRAITEAATTINVDIDRDGALYMAQRIQRSSSRSSEFNRKSDSAANMVEDTTNARSSRHLTDGDSFQDESEQILLRAGAGRKQHQEHRLYKLTTAIRERHADFVQRALEDAAKSGDKVILRLFLDASADPNAETPHGGTMLREASAKGFANLVQLLLDAGADVNKKREFGDTALHKASWFGRVDVVQKLLDAGADVNEKNTYGYTALHEASGQGLVDVVQKLLDAGADVNDKAEHGDTALHGASRRGHVDVVQKLLDTGADVNEKEESGNTALHDASRYGHVRVVRKLLDAGADVHAKNEREWTPLQLLAYACRPVFWRPADTYHEIEQMLVDAGAERPSKDTCKSASAKVPTLRRLRNKINLA